MRLLLVEDDAEIARVVTRGLEAEGFSVDVADNGIDGLWRAAETTFDAIILDLLLPGLSGYKVCERLRAAGSEVPVVVLTAKDGDLDQVDLLDLGADDFLTKPVSIKVLAARLRAAVRRSAGTATNELVVGSIRFDLAGHRCRQDGEEVALTRKEADVLYVLMAAGGATATRQEILDAAWGFDFDGDPGSVDVYINRLRNKLGSDTIRNIRGVGFQLQAPTPDPPPP